MPKKWLNVDCFWCQGKIITPCIETIFWQAGQLGVVIGKRVWVSLPCCHPELLSWDEVSDRLKEMIA